MKPDKLLIEAFLRGYDRLFDATYKVTARPDELERQREAVDALARDASGRSLAIEHTLVQPFAGQQDDDQKFSAAFLRLEQNQGLRVPGYWLQISVAVGAIPKGKDWDAVGRAVEDWLRRTLVSLPKGCSKHIVPNLEFSLEVTVWKTKALPVNEGVFVARYGAPNDFVEVVRSSLERKLPKLLRADANCRILLFQLDNVMEGPWGLADEIKKLAPEFPDLRERVEVWCAQTSQAVGEGNVHFSRLLLNLDIPFHEWPQFYASALVSPDRCEAILRVAKAHGATDVRLFGSRARGEAATSSDVDLLVTLAPGRTLLDLVAIKQDLEDLLGRSVDVVTEEAISPHIRPQVLREAITL